MLTGLLGDEENFLLTQNVYRSFLGPADNY